MKYLSLLAIVTLLACNRERKKPSKDGFDIITEKTYVLREAQPAAGDSAEAAYYTKQQEIVALLQQNNFKAHPLTNDSLLFRRENGLEVEIILPRHNEGAGKFSVIAFDPKKIRFLLI
ncbi:hypothetical protein MKQ70_27705 [Chitinophaga sedimenti]|uniref:hypothetical protein n=1 Tax=Chitinophaga sedimenti TaxID=2033606 RepID=UPI0020039394|nr:hypothetical protein [Chitinophaga sedimenti]MCK7558576.1 hypothetical protein [Chitinophaga sedimenti]